MNDQQPRRVLSLRDVGVLFAIALALCNLLWAASSDRSAARSTTEWQEVRITKLEQRVDRFVDVVVELDKKVDRQSVTLEAVAKKLGATP